MDNNTKRQLNNYLFTYLKNTIPNFQKKGKMFTCPQKHLHKEGTEELTANEFPEGSGKVYCFSPTCGSLGNFIDIYRKFSLDNNLDISENDIAELIIEEFGIKINEEQNKLFDLYEKLGFDCVPVNKNGKESFIEENWQQKSHRNRTEWEQWLAAKRNIGVKTGKLSNILILDFDFVTSDLKKRIYEGNPTEKMLSDAKQQWEEGLAKIKEKIPSLDWETLQQRSFGGAHFFHVYDEEIPKTAFDYEGIHIDIEAEGGQVVCLKGQTSIRTPNGWRFLRDLKRNDKVMSYNFDTKNIEPATIINKFKTKKDKIIKIYLDSDKVGKTISCSLEHEFFVKGKWVQAQHLKKNDEIYHLTCTNQLVTKLETKVGNGYRIGYIKGYCDGDGNIREKCIGISSKDKEGLRRIKNYLNQVFNYKPQINYYKINKPNHSNMYKLNIANKQIVDYLKEYDNYNEDYMRGYCAGFYDAEGGLYTGGEGIKFTNKKIDLLKNVQKYLKILGINNTKIRPCRDWYDLHVCEFYKQVLYFFVTTKPAILRKYPKWDRFTEHLENGEKVLKTEILTIKRNQPFILYDITVEPNHNFFANGLLTHNCTPSVVGGQNRQIVGTKINPLPKELKEFILQNCQKVTAPDKKIEVLPDAELTFENLNSNRNNTFCTLYGRLRKVMPIKTATYALSLFNNLLDKQVPQKELRLMAKEAEKYHTVDIQSISEQIINHFNLVKDILHARDLEKIITVERKDLEEALRYLQDEKKIIKIKKDTYQMIADVEWKTDFLTLNKPLDYKIPYVGDYAIFNRGSMLVLGGKTGTGKTTITVNFIEQFVKQGIKPKLITTEADSGVGEIALCRGLKEGDFLYYQTSDPLTVPFQDDEVRIIDWLTPKNGDYTQVGTIYQSLNDKLVDHGGLLIVFSQLKANGDFFAPNLIDQYASLSGKFLYPEKNGTLDYLNPYLEICKMRRPKGNQKYIQIPFNYVSETKELRIKK